jgi:tripartite-type tricarboxylate transporter receptor subunit TctC
MNRRGLLLMAGGIASGMLVTPSADAQSWPSRNITLVVPSEAICNRLSEEIRKIMSMPELRQRLETEGAQYWDVSPEEFRRHVEAEIPRWKAVVEQAKIEAPQ